MEESNVTEGGEPGDSVRGYFTDSSTTSGSWFKVGGDVPNTNYLFMGDLWTVGSTALRPSSFHRSPGEISGEK